MKTPSKLLLVLCLLALGSTAPVLRAEDGESSEKKKSHHPKGNPGEMMKEKLGLTDAQAQQMKAIHQATEAQIKAIKANESLSLEEKKAAGMKLREETKAKVDAILTAEQRAKFDKFREGHMKNHRPGKDGEEGPGEKGPKGEKHGKPGVQ